MPKSATPVPGKFLTGEIFIRVIAAEEQDKVRYEFSWLPRLPSGSKPENIIRIFSLY